MNGTADKTPGGLEKKDLKYEGDRIVSKAQQAAAKSNPALKMWREAVKKSGGLKAGKFVPIKGKVLEKAHKKFDQMKKKAGM
jgi:exosome complex RNA-binding protein Rrp4